LDLLNRGATVFAETTSELYHHLVAYALCLFTVFTAHRFGGFPNGSGYAFLIEEF
jgi:hypothetical protein